MDISGSEGHDNCEIVSLFVPRQILLYIVRRSATCGNRKDVGIKAGYCECEQKRQENATYKISFW